ncbi:unnamed protein product [Mytilus edulis]|uniref:Tc1-like transposase DDE domain-containing protein n=1 Tax=Mytilus edulis TaxID=6550 RepID=A0A8S3SLP8_MYTED|nr:unnamed protein product [Mytilus edulis]
MKNIPVLQKVIILCEVLSYYQQDSDSFVCEAATARQLILKYAPKFSALKIARLLEEKYDVKTSRQSVWRFLNRFKKSKSIRFPPRQRVRGISDLHIKAIDQWLKKDNELTANAIADKLRKTFSTKISKGYVSLIRRKLGWTAKRSIRFPPRQRVRGISDLHIKAIDQWLKKDNELTANAIADKLRKTFSTKISKRYVSLIRRKLGWTAKRVKYCHLISHVNKEKRLHYAMKVFSIKEKFLNVIFVDESTVELCSNGRMFFYKPDSDLSQLPARKQKPKHSYKDNDSKHKSKSTKEWMRQNGVLDSVMETPASSPDLNPIENVWAAMKQHLQNKMKPRKKDELVQGIADFWLTLTHQKCSAYIDHLHRVLPYVILNHGGPSGF